MQANLRAVAAADIEIALAYYRTNAGQQVALDFVDSLETALDHLRHLPLTGSLRFAYELEIPGLRAWPLQKFPYLIFYMPNNDHLDIWRVLHTHRDIPDHLTEDHPD